MKNQCITKSLTPGFAYESLIVEAQTGAVTVTSPDTTQSTGREWRKTMKQTEITGTLDQGIDNPTFGMSLIAPPCASPRSYRLRRRRLSCPATWLAQVCALALACGSTLGTEFSFPNFDGLPQQPLAGYGVSSSAVDPHDLLQAQGVSGTVVTNGTSPGPGNFSFLLTVVQNASDVSSTE